MISKSGYRFSEKITLKGLQPYPEMQEPGHIVRPGSVKTYAAWVPISTSATSSGNGRGNDRHRGYPNASGCANGCASRPG